MISERVKRQNKDEWNKVRHIMWASLAPHSKKRLDPAQVLRLEGDNLRNAPASKEHALAIAQRLLPYLKKKE
ncbi:hypothetical protein [Pontibacter mucosus]|uniref:hypothetical protein n=1 Tax=Pontibacter mucosus TaxID=1649266 RepID=UPI000D36908A|nr:hypothetical protein [Pontibacter mucosus]